ncbi:MAG: hypothetical protein IPN76_00515 [Saprospiraceae bacterium]|nr:hypothetical protein [Saprospiraceae bacterium]
MFRHFLLLSLALLLAGQAFSNKPKSHQRVVKDDDNGETSSALPFTK